MSAIAITIDVAQPTNVPGALVISYTANGTPAQQSQTVSLSSTGLQTINVALPAGVVPPVRVTLDANDPATGAGFHAERIFPERHDPPAPRPSSPAPPNGRPPFPGPRPS